MTIPYHRIAARLYNRAQVLVPAALYAASDYLLSRIDRTVVVDQGRASRFVGEARTDEGGWLPYGVVNETAVITIGGELCNRSFGMADADCGLVSYEYIKHQISEADRNPRVRSMVVDLDSHGGESHGCFTLGTFIAEVAKRKPIVASVNAFALSGGYRIASACTAIVAPNDSEVGSIGVWMLHFDLSQHFEQQGVKPTLLWKGERKVDGHPFGPLSPDAAASIDSSLEHIYGLFVNSVAADRRMTPEAVRATEARCFFGAEALTLGLVDQVGTFDDALALAQQLHSKRTVIATPPSVAVSRKTELPKTTATKQPRRIAPVTEGTMEYCTRENCGHPQSEHPDDGACTHEGCECSGYVAAAAPAAAPPNEPPAGDGDAGVVALKQRVAALEADNLRNAEATRVETLKRIGAEVRGFTTALQSKEDLRFNTKQVAALGSLLTIGEAVSSGITGSVMVQIDGKETPVAIGDTKALGAFISQQVQQITGAGAKFIPPTGELPEPKQGGIAGVSIEDFAKSALDTKAAARILAAVKIRRAETGNQKFSKNDLYRELTAKT